MIPDLALEGGIAGLRPEFKQRRFQMIDDISLSSPNALLRDLPVAQHDYERLMKKIYTNPLVERILPSMITPKFDGSQRVLKALKARMQPLVQNRDGIAVERSPDPTDEAQFACDRELTVRALDRESRMAAAIKSALKRIEDGTYGICQRCDKSISAKRLAAVPWAAYCIRCQEELDDQAGQFEDAASLQGHKSAA